MSAQLPTYAEAMRSGTPYPPVQPGQQDYPPTTAPYPTTNPPYPVSNPTGHPVPAYPTQAPYPIHNVPGYPRAPEYTSYPQSEPTAGQYVIDQQYQTTPVISHPVTHVQHIVTSAPGSNDCCCGTSNIPQYQIIQVLTEDKHNL
uniref:Uncharacterized protein n=1 Tax=Bracon brevicornis TaxID=1563983 RepID=A0A6V7I1K3_9HYME